MRRNEAVMSFFFFGGDSENIHNSFYTHAFAGSLLRALLRSPQFGLLQIGTRLPVPRSTSTRRVSPTLCAVILVQYSWRNHPKTLIGVFTREPVRRSKRGRTIIISLLTTRHWKDTCLFFIRAIFMDNAWPRSLLPVCQMWEEYIRTQPGLPWVGAGGGREGGQFESIRLKLSVALRSGYLSNTYFSPWTVRPFRTVHCAPWGMRKQMPLNGFWCDSFSVDLRSGPREPLLPPLSPTLASLPGTRVR